MTSNSHLRYYKVVTQTIGDTITVNKFKVDANTYANNILMGINYEGGDTYDLPDGSSVNIKITKTFQNYYDYEMEINENKRNIKMLKSEYVNALENELMSVFE